MVWNAPIRPELRSPSTLLVRVSRRAERSQSVGASKAKAIAPVEGATDKVRARAGGAAAMRVGRRGGGLAPAAAQQHDRTGTDGHSLPGLDIRRRREAGPFVSVYLGPPACGRGRGHREVERLPPSVDQDQEVVVQ